MTAEIATIPSDPKNLLQIAVEKGATVEQLTQLMDLQERWDRESARKDFYAARAKFQATCPLIKKDKKVSYGNTHYQYASLAGITEQVKESLEACGLTYRWEIDDAGDLIKVTCILSHVHGHSEQNTMSSLPDDSGAKNAIQQRGSSVTYLQRYTLIGALGISSAVEDDDGRSSGEADIKILLKHNEVLRDNLLTIQEIKDGIARGVYDEAVEAYSELSDEEKRALWVAPSKGGIFTTTERAAMKSDEWAEARNARGNDQ